MWTERDEARRVDGLARGRTGCGVAFGGRRVAAVEIGAEEEEERARAERLRFGAIMEGGRGAAVGGRHAMRKGKALGRRMAESIDH